MTPIYYLPGADTLIMDTLAKYRTRRKEFEMVMQEADYTPIPPERYNILATLVSQGKNPILFPDDHILFQAIKSQSVFMYGYNHPYYAYCYYNIDKETKDLLRENDLDIYPPSAEIAVSTLSTLREIYRDRMFYHHQTAAIASMEFNIFIDEVHKTIQNKNTSIVMQITETLEKAKDNLTVNEFHKAERQTYATMQGYDLGFALVSEIYFNRREN